MAETTDRPQMPPDAVMSEESTGAQPPTSSEMYQPLSLLAMAGFGLAVLYVLVVLSGSGVALFGHIPWLMPYWTFLLPAAVLIVCRAARTRILNSEGTLSGLAFTTWGSRLALLFAIPYAAYYFATFLAVRGPAIDCANDFFRRIETGQLEQAFLTAQDVSIKGRDVKQMRDEIEARFNQPMGTVTVSPGNFTRFRQERFVRFLQMDGEQAKTEPTGVSVWEYTKGGYRVILNYHVSTSLVEFDMKVETFGRDSKPGEPKGRQWQVVLARGQTSIVPDSVTETARGQDFEQKTLKAQKFAREWVDRANEVDSLQPSERESYSKLIRGLDTFWSGNEQREDLTRRIRNSFATGRGKQTSFNLNLQSSGIPLLREKDGRTTAWIDVTLRYLEEDGPIPQYVVEGQLVLSADSNTVSNWRPEALQIESGRTSPEMRRMQRGAASPNPEEAIPDKGRRPPDKPAAGPTSPRPPRLR